MRNLDSELAFFRIRLGKQFTEQVASGQPIPKEAIQREVEKNPFSLSADECEYATRELEHNFTTTQKRGNSVKSDYRPWLRQRRPTIDFYYWDRLKRYYLEGNVLPPQVVATLDSVTDEVLDYSGDPSDKGTWARRGMVMGHVQSGKTTNYSALICKAADAGYKIVILLAGITNSLRTQTQERLDDTFIGKKSVFHAAAAEALPIITYAAARRFPAYGTSRDRDFTRDAAGTVNRDAHVRIALREEGWRVAVIWECAIESEPDKSAKRLGAWLRSSRRFSEIGAPRSYLLKRRRKPARDTKS